MDLIEQAIDKLGSAKEVAKYLRISQPFLSQIRSGVRPIPPLHEAKLAELLEMNPAQAFVEATIRQAGKEDAANLKRWFSRVAAIIAAVFVAGGASGLWTPIFPSANASEPPSRYASELPPEYSMRPMFRRTARRKGRLRAWLRSQLGLTSAGKVLAGVMRRLRGPVAAWA